MAFFRQASPRLIPGSSQLIWVNHLADCLWTDSSSFVSSNTFPFWFLGSGWNFLLTFVFFPHIFSWISDPFHLKCLFLQLHPQSRYLLGTFLKGMLSAFIFASPISFSTSPLLAKLRTVLELYTFHRSLSFQRLWIFRRRADCLLLGGRPNYLPLPPTLNFFIFIIRHFVRKNSLQCFAERFQFWLSLPFSKVCSFDILVFSPQETTSEAKFSNKSCVGTVLVLPLRWVLCRWAWKADRTSGKPGIH